jgi:hypothetical protein
MRKLSSSRKNEPTILLWGMRDGLWLRSYKRGLHFRPIAWNQQFTICTVFGVLP